MEKNTKSTIVIRALAMAALVLLLTAQIKHSLFVYNATSHYDDPWFAWGFAVRRGTHL